MRYIIVAFIIFSGMIDVNAQNNLSIYTGFSMIPLKLKPLNKSYEQTLGVEFKKGLSKASSVNVGLEFEYQYLYIFRDSNVYELLRNPICNPNNNIYATFPFCPYFFTEQHINMNFPLSYEFFYLKNKKFELYIKSGFLLRFAFINHINASYPKLNDKGVLLDAGPYVLNRSNTQFRLLNYDLLFATGLNYNVNRNFKLSLTSQYRHGFEGRNLPLIYRKNNLYVQLGMMTKL